MKACALRDTVTYTCVFLRCVGTIGLSSSAQSAGGAALFANIFVAPGCVVCAEVPQDVVKPLVFVCGVAVHF